MRHEQGQGSLGCAASRRARTSDQVLERRVRDGDAVVRARASAELVQDHQRALLGGGGAQDRRALGHLLQERAAPHRQVVGGAHARVHALERGERHGARGDEAPALRHERERRRLPHETRLSAHVRASHHQRARVFRTIRRRGDCDAVRHIRHTLRSPRSGKTPERDRVGHDALAAGERSVQHGVAALADVQKRGGFGGVFVAAFVAFVGVVQERRAAVPLLPCERRERAQRVEPRRRARRRAQLQELPGALHAQEMAPGGFASAHVPFARALERRRARQHRRRVVPHNLLALVRADPDPVVRHALGRVRELDEVLDERHGDVAELRGNRRAGSDERFFKRRRFSRAGAVGAGGAVRGAPADELFAQLGKKSFQVPDRLRDRRARLLQLGEARGVRLERGGGRGAPRARRLGVHRREQRRARRRRLLVARLREQAAEKKRRARRRIRDGKYAVRSAT